MNSRNFFCDRTFIIINWMVIGHQGLPTPNQVQPLGLKIPAASKALTSVNRGGNYRNNKKLITLKNQTTQITYHGF